MGRIIAMSDASRFVMEEQSPVVARDWFMPCCCADILVVSCPMACVRGTLCAVERSIAAHPSDDG